jgi:hypothetical protein
MRIVPARRGLWVEVASNLASIIAVIGVLVKLLAKTENNFMLTLTVLVALTLVFVALRLLRQCMAFAGYYDLRITDSSMSVRVRKLEAKKPQMDTQMTQQLSGGNPWKQVLPYLCSERFTFDISQCKPFKWQTHHWRELDSSGCYFTHAGQQYMIVAYNKEQAAENYQALLSQ